MKRPSLGTIVVALVLTACSTGVSAGGQRSARSSDSSTQRSVLEPIINNNPAPAPLAVAPGPALGAQPSLSAAPIRIPNPGASIGMPNCPPIVANPVGCPVALPPPAVIPPVGHARIVFCSPVVMAAPIPPSVTPLVLCGGGFLPSERVTITVTGRMGSASSQTVAGPDGSFRSPLPPTTCRIAPLWIVARGDHGSASNAIGVPLLACRSR